MTDEDKYTLAYWFLKNKANEDRCMFWQAVATVSLAFNGMVLGALLAAVIFR